MYSVHHVGILEYEVEFYESSVGVEGDGHGLSNDDGFPKSLFKRIRRVVVEKHGFMHCTCCRFETSGLFCCHIDCVVNAVHERSDKEWGGFIQFDVSVRWWASYMFLAYKDLTETKVQQMFDLLLLLYIYNP